MAHGVVVQQMQFSVKCTISERAEKDGSCLSAVAEHFVN